MSNSPSLFRRLACMLYEALLLIAIFMLAVALFVAVLGDATHGMLRYLMQFYLWLIAGIYFTYSWKRGATLAMQTWKIGLESRDGQVLSYQQAAVRYAIASLLFGVTFLWALFDQDHLALHDRIAGTRLSNKTKRPS